MEALVVVGIAAYVLLGIFTAVYSFTLKDNPYDGFDSCTGVVMMLSFAVFWPIALPFFKKAKKQ